MGDPEAYEIFPELGPGSVRTRFPPLRALDGQASNNPWRAPVLTARSLEVNASSPRAAPSLVQHPGAPEPFGARGGLAEYPRPDPRLVVISSTFTVNGSTYTLYLEEGVKDRIQGLTCQAYCSKKWSRIIGEMV